MKRTNDKLKKWEKPEMKVLSIKKTFQGEIRDVFEDVTYNDS